MRREQEKNKLNKVSVHASALNVTKNILAAVTSSELKFVTS